MAVPPSINRNTSRGGAALAVLRTSHTVQRSTARRPQRVTAAAV
jgi:hypothetical protein